jgi:2-polyprenyl-6-methoxyphenol hydroxylase-like FAD-dependent oxidoreductase
MSLSSQVVIAGAGIGGLTLAIALRKRGVNAVVLERASTLRAVGAGITLQPNAMRCLESLGLASKAQSAGCCMKTAAIRTYLGRVISSLDVASLATDHPAVGIRRSALQELLLSELPSDIILTSAQVATYSQSDNKVSVQLKDGRTIEGSVLVGADGLRSAVREQLLGKSPLRYAGYTSYRGLVEMKKLPKIPEVCEYWGPGSRFGTVPVGAEHLYWFATLNAPEGEREQSPLSTVETVFGTWADPIPAIVKATNAEDVVRTDIHDRLPIRGWSQGLVTLLGDAAHPTTPNMGQGGGMAIEDAVVLARCLSEESSVAQALAKYEQQREPRTRKIVEESWTLGRVAQWHSPVSRWFRDTTMKWTPQSVMQSRVADVVGYTA